MKDEVKRSRLMELENLIENKQTAGKEVRVPTSKSKLEKSFDGQMSKKTKTHDQNNTSLNRSSIRASIANPQKTLPKKGSSKLNLRAKNMQDTYALSKLLSDSPVSQNHDHK